MRNPLGLCYNALVKVISSKKGFILVFSISIFLVFSSCSGSQGLETANFDKETLRGIALEKERETLWTRELESVRLEPHIVAAAELNGSYIFPYLSGFGSLDTTGISKELSEFLEKFCTAVSEWKISADFFAEDSLFSLVLFKNDVEKLWKDIFNTDFPANNLIKNDKSNEKRMESQKVFISYIYGAPFTENSGVFVPVRFYAQKGIVDAALFIENSGEASEKSEVKIRQIQIIKWETSLNGK